MDLFLSKILPLFIYPLGLACILLIIGLLMLFFGRVTKRWKIWQRISSLLALALLWLGGNHWVASSLAKSLEWRYLPLDEIPPAEVIVVLGGGTEPLAFPRPIVEINGAGDRVLYAAWLYKQDKAEHILVSGGRIEWLENTGSDPYPIRADYGTIQTSAASPAEEMSSLLQMMGVPREALWLESESRNTYENAVNSRRLLEERDIKRIILVTSAMHMPRAIRLFEAQGLEVVPAAVDFTATQSAADQQVSWETTFLRLFPGAGNLSLTTRVIKEYLGILFYNLRGWQ